MTKANLPALSKVKLKELDVLVNDALLFYLRGLAADNSSLTAKQLTKAYNDFYGAVKKLDRSLPKSRSPLFWAISDKGDAFASNAGPHPGLNPGKAGVSSPDEEGRTADQLLIFRSDERLDEFLSIVKQVSAWLDGESACRNGCKAFTFAFPSWSRTPRNI